MSVGNLKTSGQKGNNWTWQYKVLKGLENIAASIIQNDNEFEAQVVVETCAGPPTTEVYLLEVRIFDPTTGTFGIPTYYLPGSNTPVPLTPGCTIEYANDATVLAQILTELQDINLGIPASLGQQVMADSMPVVIASDQTPIEVDIVSSVVLDVTGSTVTVQDGGGSITVDGGTGVTRTPAFLRPSGISGVLAAGSYSASFASVGTADATVGGMILKPGETINFDAGAINNTLTSITFDTTTAGAELIIIALT